MKKYLLIGIALAFTMCCKKTDGIDAELAKLPPITQTGANTFGCLVNGKAYLPSGNNGWGSNLFLDVNPADSLFDLRVYSTTFYTRTSYIGIGSKIVKSKGAFSFESIKPKTWVTLLYINNCYTPNYDTVFNLGNLKITRYDVTNGIFAGEFECKVYTKDCTDTVRITNGRFDYKF